MDVNVLCLKKIDGPGSWQVCVYRCKFNHDAEEPTWVDKVCKADWIKIPKNKKMCMDCITYETTELVNREELQQLLESQSDSALTMGLVGSITEDNVESVYLVNLISGLEASPLNKEIQDRVNQVMNTEEVGPPSSTKRRRNAEEKSVMGTIPPPSKKGSRDRSLRSEFNRG